MRYDKYCTSSDFTASAGERTSVTKTSSKSRDDAVGSALLAARYATQSFFASSWCCCATRSFACSLTRSSGRDSFVDVAP
ncbi:hypothetical protein DIPPA_25353 [Diplonema papillatum]|nr:hypothetical protein DIPPA_25353 [Diplonema papillatum]